MKHLESPPKSENNEKPVEYHEQLETESSESELQVVETTEEEMFQPPYQIGRLSIEAADFESEEDLKIKEDNSNSARIREV
jgi:hypothetical protein